MNNIKVYTLQGCDKCESFKKALTKKGLIYKEISCETNPTECDKIEAITNTDSYPMSIIEDSDGVKVLYVAEKYTDMGTRQIESGTTVIGVYSIDNMLDLINKD